MTVGGWEGQSLFRTLSGEGGDGGGEGVGVSGGGAGERIGKKNVWWHFYN